MAANMRAQQTDLARKYGGGFRYFNSGITPIAAEFGQNLSDAEKEYRDALTAHQKRAFHGFTTRDLVNLDAIDNRILKPCDLGDDGPIHAMLSRPRWAPWGENPEEVRYNPNNDELWAALRPALLITSRLLPNLHALPFFSSLDSGPLKPIPNTRRGTGRDWKGVPELFSFDSGPAYVGLRPERFANEVEQHFEETLPTYWRYRFSFYKDKAEIKVGEDLCAPCAIAGVRRRAITRAILPRDIDQDVTLWTFLHVQDVAPLLRNDLTDAERKGHQWFLATILLHEITHAMWHHISRRRTPGSTRELYYRNEALSELGYALESAFFKGLIEPMLRWGPTRRDPPPALGYWLESGWPTLQDTDKRTHKSPILKGQPGLGKVLTRHPILVSFFEQMQREQFWSAEMRGFGLEAITASMTASIASQTTLDLLGPEDDPNENDGRGPEPTFAPPPPTGTLHQPWGPEFIRNLDVLSNLLDKNPQQRKQEEFGRKLINSACVSSQFWNSTLQIQELVNSMRSDSEKVEAAKARWRDARVKEWDMGVLMPLLHSQIQAVSQARMIHEQMILNLCSEEVALETIYDTRRTDLRNWNRGAQTFARETRKIFDEGFNNPFTEQINNDVTALEFCRLCIWDPHDTTSFPSKDPAEMADLGRALEEITNQQWDSANTVCQQIINDTARSKYAEVCACILLGMIETYDYEKRANWAVQGIHQLNALRFGGPPETAQFRVQWDAEMAALHQDAEKSLYALEKLSLNANAAIPQMEYQGMIRRSGNPPPGINPNSNAFNTAPAPAWNPSAAAFQPGIAYDPSLPADWAGWTKQRRQRWRKKQQGMMEASGLAGAVAHQPGSGAGTSSSSNIMSSTSMGTGAGIGQAGNRGGGRGGRQGGGLQSAAQHAATAATARAAALAMNEENFPAL